jgi:phosphoserine aminotransferase
MASKKPKISKQAAAATTRHITFTIPETFEIIMKPGSATCQSVNMAAYEIGLLDHPNIREKLSIRNYVIRGAV